MHLSRLMQVCDLLASMPGNVKSMSPAGWLETGCKAP